MRPIRRSPLGRNLQRYSTTGIRLAWPATPGSWPADRNTLSDSLKLSGNVPKNEASASRTPCRRSMTGFVRPAAFAHLGITSSSRSPAEALQGAAVHGLLPGQVSPAGRRRMPNPSAANPSNILIVDSQPLDDQAAQRSGWPSRPPSANRQRFPKTGLRPQSAQVRFDQMG